MTIYNLQFEAQNSGLLDVASRYTCESVPRFAVSSIKEYCHAIAPELRQRSYDLDPRAGAAFNDESSVDEVESVDFDVADVPWAEPKTLAVEIPEQFRNILMSEFLFELEHLPTFEERAQCVVSEVARGIAAVASK